MSEHARGRERAVVIVDEAGQLDGRQLLDLIRLVRERNGRLILCGDTRQHGPVEASDALRAIERYAGLRVAELNQIRRQEPKRGRTVAERKHIRDYREAVKAAAAGEVERSFEKLERLGAVVECGVGEQSTRLCDGYLAIAAAANRPLLCHKRALRCARLTMPFVSGFASAGCSDAMRRKSPLWSKSI